MELARSPRDLCAWVDAKASELSQTKEAKAYARSGELLPKKLMEELRPFGLFASQRFGSEGVKCIPNLGNEGFDGEIQFSDASTPPIYVEITYAKDGYDERLRLGILNEKGSVNVLGKLTVSGTKAARTQCVEVENEAVDHDSTVSAGLALVKERLTGKSGKKYGPQHVLILVVEDYIAFRSDEDRSALRRCAEAAIADLRLDFGGIYLLGSSGGYLECVDGEI
ncbi:MAG: hypothetical protein IPM20_11700 [Gammaproteobacteria bacterium]|nr:hypothetical protein [Gammaproteobacteria bacterium]